MKKIIILISVILIGVAGYFSWLNASAITIGEVSFTHNDIDKLFAAEQKIAKVVQNDVIKSKQDVLYNLAITSLQKEILLQNKIDLNSENNTKIIEKTVGFKDIYTDIKKDLGEDYYRLLIEPVIINKLFYSVYENFNAASQNAKRIIELLKQYEFNSVANAVNIKPVKLNISKNNKILLDELGNKTGVYQKIIQFDNKLIVANILGYDEKYIKTHSFVFEKPSYRDFLKKVLNINTIKFPFYSLYSMDDVINKKGSVLK